MLDGRSSPAVRARARHERVRVRATDDREGEVKLGVGPQQKAGNAPSSAPSAAPTSKPAGSTTASQSKTAASTPSSTPSSSPTPAKPSTTSSSTASTQSHSSSAAPVTSDRAISSTPIVPAANGHQATTPLAASASPSVSATPKASSGLSGGAVGGIVAAVLLVCFGGIIILVRKIMIRKRQMKRNTWGAGIFPTQQEKYNAYSDSTGSGDFGRPLSEKLPMPSSPKNSDIGLPNNHTSIPPPPLANILTPPPMSYNNPIASDMYGTSENAPFMTPMSGSMPTPMSMPSPATATETAVVRCIFIPSLPDELPITAGDVVQVIKAFDDGWALCANIRGETGVVPQECLEIASASAPGKRNTTVSVASGDYRDMRRVSSLANSSAYGS